MSRHRVQLYGQNRSVEVDTRATPGAVVGVNLTLEDGTVVTYDMLFAPPPAGQQPGGGADTVYWRTIMEIPPNVTALQEQEGSGLYVLTGPGASATRTLTTSTLSLQNASGASGNPVVDLGELEDAGGGALRKIERDQYGRVSGTSEATTDDLPEGSNLYFTDERVDDRVQAADYSLAGAWSFQHNITVGGMTVGLGPGENESNLAIGSGALSARTTAQNTVAIGAQALASNTSVSGHTAIGFRALNLVNGGGQSVAIGFDALRDAATSNGSVAIGNNALRDATSAVSHVAIGSGAYILGGGSRGVAIGRNALSSLASGLGNVALGYSAGSAQTGGGGNVYLGNETGITSSPDNANVSGQRNTFIGERAGPASPAQVSNSTAIGADSVVGTSNTVVLGRTTDNTVLGATGDDGSGAKLQVTGAIKATSEYRVGANKVVGARDTGWTAVAGTAQKGGGTTYTAPMISDPPTQAEVQAMADALQDAHQKIKALQDALTAHGLIGS